MVTFPPIFSTIAYQGEPYTIMDYTSQDGVPVVDLGRCPGTLADPEAGWHDGWEPPEPTIVPLTAFRWTSLETSEPHKIGGLDAVVGEAWNLYDGKAKNAESALSLLLCHGINAGVDCENFATHLYGTAPYDYAPMCDDCGDNG